MNYLLPPLGFDFSSLEPYIDRETVEIHYTKHHVAYLDKLNLVLKPYPEIASKSIETLLKFLPIIYSSSVAGRSNDPFLIKIGKESIKNLYWGIRNFGGGHFNHSFFWKCLSGNSTSPSKKLIELIEKNFNSLSSFKDKFLEISLARFGSGWIWLYLDSSSNLILTSSSNQDCPISDGNEKLLLTCDLWEHAYYLKYKYDRKEFINNFWNIIDWNFVSNNYENYISSK